jgi:hypothetical protein
MKGEIKDPAMKKLFDIPEEYYKNPFLRDIKMRYLMFGSLSEKQLSAFKDVVEKIKNKTNAKELSSTPLPSGGARKINKEKRPVIE